MTIPTLVRPLAEFPADDTIDRRAVLVGTQGREEYRYRLERGWDRSLPLCVWLMLNPSTADALVDDATIRKCMRFAFQWGYGGIVVVNLYAWRSRHPKALLDPAIDPVGPENDDFIRQACADAQLVVCGWGSLPFAAERARTVPAMVRSPHCLGLTRSGEPRHPLMLAYATPVQRFESRPAAVVS